MNPTLQGWHNGRPVFEWAGFTAEMYETPIGFNIVWWLNHPDQIEVALEQLQTLRHKMWSGLPSSWYIGWTA